MKKKSRRKHTEEFKRRAVGLMGDAEKSNEQVARELGVAPSLLYEWRSSLGGDQETDSPGHERRPLEGGGLEGVPERGLLHQERDVLRATEAGRRSLYQEAAEWFELAEEHVQHWAYRFQDRYEFYGSTTGITWDRRDRDPEDFQEDVSELDDGRMRRTIRNARSALLMALEGCGMHLSAADMLERYGELTTPETVVIVSSEEPPFTVHNPHVRLLALYAHALAALFDDEE